MPSPDRAQEKWSAVYNVRTILLSIQSLLGGTCQGQGRRCARPPGLRLARLPVESLLLTSPLTPSRIRSRPFGRPQLGQPAERPRRVHLEQRRRVQEGAAEAQSEPRGQELIGDLLWRLRGSRFCDSQATPLQRRLAGTLCLA